MKKRGYIILISILLLGVLIGIGRFVIKEYMNNKFEKHAIEKYGFEISYPKSYKEVVISGDDKKGILSGITTSESGEQISEYIQNLNFAETVKNLKNEVNGIKLLIEAISIEKTTLSLEEICDRYVVMFQIYNEERIIKDSKFEIIKINEEDVGKVTIRVKGENEDAMVVAYLLSLDDKEITVTFIGTETLLAKRENEINKIINSLKIN